MGSHRLASPPSRRSLRAGATAPRPTDTPPPVDAGEPAPPAPPRRRLACVSGRLGVLAALVGVTVVVPVSQTALADSGAPTIFASQVALPSTLDALTATPPSQLPPASLLAAEGTAEALSLELEKVSRAAERSPLPNCDGQRPPAGENGLLPASSLCTLFDGHTLLRSDAAVRLAEFNEAFVARFGADLCLSSGYRTFAQQRSVKATRGGLAAAPGKSNHGWGLAVDLCSIETSGQRWAWLNENAPLYGFDNPAWARPGGSGPYEKWHWEYTKAVMEDGEYYG